MEAFMMMDVKRFIATLLLSFLLTFESHASSEGIDDCRFKNSVDLTDNRIFGGHLLEDDSVKPELVGIDSFIEVISNPLHARYCEVERKECVKLCCDPKNCFEVDDKYWTCWGRLTTIKEYSSDLIVRIDKDGYKFEQIFKVYDVQTCRHLFPIEAQRIKNVNVIKYKNGSFSTNQQRNATSEVLRLDEISKVDRFAQYRDIALIVSIPFLILSAMIYGFVKKLRDVHGMCIMSYLLTFAAADSILEIYRWLSGLIMFPESICIFIGYAVHFCYISAFLWLNVIGYNLWRHCGGRTEANQSRADQRRIYIRHSIRVWVSACFQTLMFYCMQRFLHLTQPSNLITGNKMCARSEFAVPDESYSTMLYPYDVVFVCILYNLVMLIRISWNIYITGRKVRSLQQPNQRQRTLSYVAKNLGIFFRLTIIMTISWLFEVFSYVTLTTEERQEYEGIVNWTELFNAAHGIVIFILIITNRNVLKLIREQYGVYKRTRLLRIQDPILLTRRQDCAVRFDCFRQNGNSTTTTNSF